MTTHAQRIEAICEQMEQNAADAASRRELVALRREVSRLRDALTAAQQDLTIANEQLAQARQRAEWLVAA